jgi:hypothetical protein
LLLHVECHLGLPFLSSGKSKSSVRRDQLSCVGCRHPTPGPRMRQWSHLPRCDEANSEAPADHRVITRGPGTGPIVKGRRRRTNLRQISHTVKIKKRARSPPASQLKPCEPQAPVP